MPIDNNRNNENFATRSLRKGLQQGRIESINLADIAGVLASYIGATDEPQVAATKNVADKTPPVLDFGVSEIVADLNETHEPVVESAHRATSSNTEREIPTDPNHHVYINGVETDIEAFIIEGSPSEEVQISDEERAQEAIETLSSNERTRTWAEGFAALAESENPIFKPDELTPEDRALAADMGVEVSDREVAEAAFSRIFGAGTTSSDINLADLASQIGTNGQEADHSEPVSPSSSVASNEAGKSGPERS